MSKLHFSLLLSVTLAIIIGYSCQFKPVTPPSQPKEIPRETQSEPTVELETEYAIPAEYQPLYEEISQKLEAFDIYLDSHWDGTKSNVIFGAELLPANGHQGEKLLTEENYKGTLAYLNGLQSLGINGVKIAISYPILAPDFPDSDRYLEYYKDLAQELRKRDMKILVAIGNFFQDSSFTDLQVSISNLTFAQYRQTKRQIAERIIKEIHPDYLTIANEPSTEAMTTGLKVTVPEFTETVRYVLNGLDRSNVLVGAGAGTWNHLDYVKSLARDTSLDYIDVHIYPANFLEQAITIADIAHTYNKRLIIGEAWTYKVYDRELGDLDDIATQAVIFGRDIYSFWEPLDSRFLETLVKLANYNGYEFISPFWSKYFFAYLDYETVPKNLNYRQLTQLSNQEAFQNILSNEPTPTGLTYQELINTASK
ncbi:MAG: hypothetical protein JSV54_01130 [Chloroflexota bacterium]|nr:MAG: hypothetical protein JSV54_01130 [Chloroflexota bacterium]